MINSIGLHDTDLRKDKNQNALKVVQLLDELSKASLNTEQLQESLNQSLSEESPKRFGSTDASMSGEDPEKILQESLAQLGLPIKCDTDLRRQVVDGGGEQELQEKNDLEVKSCFQFIMSWNCHIVL